MNCAKCGSVLPEGVIYCPICNAEVSVISDINLLEEDLLKAMLEEEHLTLKKDQADKQLEIRRRKEAEKQKKKKQKQLRMALAIIIILLVLVAGGLFYFFYHRSHSEEYLYAQATELYQQKDYEKALSYLDRALLIDSENAQVWLLEGQCYYNMKDYEAAENALLHTIALDADKTEAYDIILKVYDEQGDYQSIVNLKAGVTDAGLLSLFDNYLLAVPEIEPEEGEYDEYVTVKLSCKDRTLDLYYTIDGKTPDMKSSKYDGEFTIEQEGDITLKAVSMDKKGNYSEVVSAVYSVELAAPDQPTVSPDSGQFTSATKVVITVPAGVDVYYTWNGNTPTRESNKYSGPISIPEGNNILSVIAVNEKGLSSEVLKCNYIYYPEVNEEEVSEGE